ncbi:MAG: hypothetical protein MJK14_03655 [Rivularia sp. ALOHA_DT_140]|nr:hypothetical protein [Rivularia sp. ALOHA_DT_140]
MQQKNYQKYPAGVYTIQLLKDKKTYQKYLEDDKITVAELGGWECAKCHY